LTPVDPEQLLAACGADPSWVCEQTLEWSGGNESLARTVDFLLAKPLTILLILVIAYIVNRLVRRAIRSFVDRVAKGEQPGMIRTVIDKAPSVLTGPSLTDPRAAARAQTIGQVLRSISTALIFGIAALLILGELGINLGPLIAGAGIAGLAIGFGAQSLVKDFVSGLFILLEDQYGVGDVVDLGEASGTVEWVTLRATRLRDAEGTVWHVPNGEVRRVGNKSQQWARAVVDVAIAYGTDVQGATDVIREVATSMAHEDRWAALVQEDPEVLGVESLGADGMSIRVSVQTEPGEQWAVMRELRLRLREALDAAGMEAPYHRTLAAPAPPPPAGGQGPPGAEPPP
jgi:small conductance mechanosensitive channel